MTGRLALGAIVVVALAAAVFVVLLNLPGALFPYHVSAGRLSLSSDRPFDAARGRAVLTEAESRLETSPIDDRRSHGVYVTNAPWRRLLFFSLAQSAGGLNYYPLTNNVFVRAADIDRNRVIGESGRPAAPPRSLAYYVAHEIAHSFTAERLGPGRLWNYRLPQWVREGYADYVGFGGRVNVDDLYRRYRRGEAALDYGRSGTYARFRLLVAYFLTRKCWTIDHLLTSNLTEAQAETLMTTRFVRR